MERQHRIVVSAVCGLLVLGAWMPRRASAQERSFFYQQVVTRSTPGASLLTHPTSLALAPNGHLFIAQQDGRIFDVAVNSDFTVSTIQTINTIYNMGPVNVGRQVTGIAFAPNGDLFVSHSDAGFQSTSIGPNSGVITRLSASGGYTSSATVVSGLPRSYESHGPNGLAYRVESGTPVLYLAQGGNTNAGLTSTYFDNAVEDNYSAAILRFDLSLSLPLTLSSSNVYASGFRNPYDLLWHSNGKLYATDNGPNTGAGNRPVGGSNCGDSGVSPDQADELNWVQAGHYYGHPNPVRYLLGNTLECTFNAGDAAIHSYAGGHTSSDGIAEYTSAAFPWLQGQIITANFANADKIVSVRLTGGGTTAAADERIIRAGIANPLDVVVRQSDGAIFVAEYGLNPTTSAVSVLRVQQAAPVDFSGTRQSNITVFRPSTAEWYIRKTSTTWDVYAYGAGGDIPVPADYDGDGRADLAVFRPSDGSWSVHTSSSGYTGGFTIFWGAGGDIPVPGDYDGDGRADLAVFRPANWYILTSSSNYTSSLTITYGAGGDIPVPGDYDGDGATDIAVFRPSDATWSIHTAASGFTSGFTSIWGAGGDIPVPADYDGDGHTDLCVFRPSDANWYIRTSSSGYTSGPTITWGAGTDIPRAIDYDGDGRGDLTVYRPSEGNWYIRTSSSNWTSGTTITWGVTGDIPLGRDY